MNIMKPCAPAEAQGQKPSVLSPFMAILTVGRLNKTIHKSQHTHKYSTILVVIYDIMQTIPNAEK